MTVKVNHCPGCLADNLEYIMVPLHVFEVQLKSWRGGALAHGQVTKGIGDTPCTSEGKVYCLAPSAQDVFERFGACVIKSVTWLGPGYDWHIDNEARRKAGGMTSSGEVLCPYCAGEVSGFKKEVIQRGMYEGCHGHVNEDVYGSCVDWLAAVEPKESP